MTKNSIRIIVCVALVVAGIACIISGIILLHEKSVASCHKDHYSPKASSILPVTCNYSQEALRVGLPEFLQKVQDTFYDLHPEKIYLKPNVLKKEILEKFQGYDPSPAKIKLTTDKSFELLAEIKGKKITKQLLKPRERKALSQVMHYLQHVFGMPYDGNYYTGYYLLGPGFFCVEMQSICTFTRLFSHWIVPPSSVNEVQILLNKIKTLNHTFSQYRQNLIDGVRAGMVRDIDDCKRGLHSFFVFYRNMNKVEDVMRQRIAKGLTRDSTLDKLSKEEKEKWFTKYNKTVKQDIRDHVLKYIGEPLYKLITYLKTTYLEHCLPVNESSGLSGLPLTHVYINGSKTNQLTYPYLPTGQRLNGSKAYESIMPYFTTSDITPNEVHDLGLKMINKLYAQVLELARNETHTSNTTQAKEMFARKLNDSSMFYGADLIPEIESNATAHERCTSSSSAKTYCPVRYKAMQRLVKDLYKVMSLMDSKTVEMFYFTGSKHTTPNCPVDVIIQYSPQFLIEQYHGIYPDCHSSSRVSIPFHVRRLGPKYGKWTMIGHEARPGHHTQTQGLLEHFRDLCGGVIGWLDTMTRYTAFNEGWAVYAEYPLIPVDMEMYANKPMYKYGMLRGQLWRAIRLVVDTGLHYKGFSHQKALQYFQEYMWETSDVMQQEVMRYQSVPGQATAYMVGQQHIIKLREHAQKELDRTSIDLIPNTTQKQSWNVQLFKGNRA
ncbi:uncharacterized protein LOC116298050 isoform X3 [Actinia tenebrosa]|uniref:Uncharacterized protein LOC116298050 isoform X3 n=1 Tax=Actinia tenebrosa TaxID=6105 RepID=A0A6P8I342_ACTTE|nr:uncharacterized protein LOC116298050 isoform X3 [Actinia tenebrosa]